jgi:hypothetical protein
MRAITLHKKSAIIYHTEVIALEEQKSYLRKNHAFTCTRWSYYYMICKEVACTEIAE